MMTGGEWRAGFVIELDRRYQQVLLVMIAS